MSSSILVLLQRLNLAQYTQVPSESQSESGSEWAADEKVDPIEHYSRASGWPLSLLVLVLCLLTSAGGFAVGFQVRGTIEVLPTWVKSSSRGGDKAQISLIQQTWEYDRSFGAQPPTDNSTEAQWDALIPKGQGFVRYPTDAPHVSAVSAVHQLHCLYSIRRALFAQPGVPIAGINMEHLKPPHMRHCFDYLRQALICSADSTLEPYRTDLGGVTGWGFPRVCRNYSELKMWAEARRTNDNEGFVEIVNQVHPIQHSKAAE